MRPQHQTSLQLINHKTNSGIVQQRFSDGYVNATELCKAAGKLWADYYRNKATKEFLTELSTDMGIPITLLIQQVRNGFHGIQGTWIHPHVAIHFGQWLSPKFAVQVSKWVYDWMSGKNQPAKLPYHLERHLMNLSKIPIGYFSVLQEMTNFLVGPMEANGYRLPEKLMPDIPHAKLLCQHLRDDYDVDTKALKKYSHEFPDGRVVRANLYPVEYLAAFRRLMAEVWMPQRATKYFKTRDPSALPALDKILLLTDPERPTRLPANHQPFKRKA